MKAILFNAKQDPIGVLELKKWVGDILLNEGVVEIPLLSNPKEINSIKLDLFIDSIIITADLLHNSPQTVFLITLKREYLIEYVLKAISKKYALL